MKILGIETSCDETGAAIIAGITRDQPVRLLSNSLATSLESHAVTGGIIPENAAREQLKYILPVINEALKKAELDVKKPAIDAIAVTYGPGLIGSLLVGIETAKTLSYLWDIPIIPVNHLYGHIYANWLMANSKWQLEAISFPAIALVVSGGHTDLVLLKNHGNLEVIGGTRDDAAGEAFDKIGRLIGLAYPAGPAISKLAAKGNSKAFTLPRPMWDSKNFDFSFSGLKTSVLNLIKKNEWNFSINEIKHNEKLIADISACVQRAIVDVLILKTMQAVSKYQVKSLLLGGGVAANELLKKEFTFRSLDLGIKLFIPPSYLCTDNAAMIASAGFYNNKKKSWKEVNADPELYY